MKENGKKNKIRFDRIFLSLFLVIMIILIISFIYRAISNNNDNVQTNNDIQSQNNQSVVTSDISNDTTTTPQTELVTETVTTKSVEVIDGATYIDGILIINKSYSVSPEYQGYEGGYDETKPTPPQGLFPEVIDAFNNMESDASDEGLNIYIASGYRSYYYQVNVYNRYCEYDPPEVVDTYSARPGFSEHQSGYAFDLNTIDDSFADTPEGKWVDQNCYKYGFIIRFPKDKEDITGYQYESWHLRYVGVDVATYIHENNLCLEEYLGVDSVYAEDYNPNQNWLYT